MKKKNKYPYSPRRLRWFIKYKDGLNKESFKKVLNRVYRFIDRSNESNRAPLFITIFTTFTDETKDVLLENNFIQYKNISYGFFDMGFETQGRKTRVYIEIVPYKDFK